MSIKFSNNLSKMLLSFSTLVKEVHDISDLEARLAHAGGLMALLGYMQEITLVSGTTEDTAGFYKAIDSLNTQVQALSKEIGEDIPDEISFSFPTKGKYEA